MKWLHLLKPNHHLKNSHLAPSTEQGFTLLEVLMVVFMVGILAALGIPSWLSMVNNTRLSKAQDAVALAINDAQRQATQRKSSWQVTIQQGSPTSLVWWAVHPQGTAPSPQQKQNIEQDRLIISPSSWTVAFDEKGQTENTGRIQLSLENGGESRCVIVTTLLGSVRKATGAACIE